VFEHRDKRYKYHENEQKSLVREEDGKDEKPENFLMKPRFKMLKQILTRSKNM